MHDGTDLSRLRWARGGYDVADLEKLLTGNDARLSMVLKSLRDRVLDTSRIRASSSCD